MPRPRAERGVSGRSIQLLEELDSAYRSLFGRGRVPALVREVAGLGEPKTLIYLRCLLLSSRAEIRTAANEAARELISLVAPQDWVWFDDVMRSGWLGSQALYRQEWQSVAPLEFFQAMEGLDDPRTAVALGLAHRNGFIRESALEQVVQLGSAAFLPLVILRLRDWVPEVRTAAGRALCYVLDASADEEVLDAIPLLTHLAVLEQTPELATGATLIRKRLVRDDGSTLLKGLAHDEVLTRRYCYEFLRSLDLRGPVEVFSLAIEDPDPVIQEWAVGIAEDLDDSERTRCLRRAAEVRRGRVSLKALRALWEVDREQAVDLVDEALLARAASVRQFAIWALRQRGSFEPGEFYRKVIDDLSGRALAAAITELGRLGIAADASRLRPHVEKPAGSRIRAVALRAIYELNPAEARPFYERALHDESRRVARAARDLLVRDSGFPACRDAVRWVRTADHQHTQFYSLSVALRRCPKWTRLALLLELGLEEGTPISVVARRGIVEWRQKLNRGVVEPTLDERQRIMWLLSRSEGGLSQDLVDQIRFALR